MWLGNPAGSDRKLKGKTLTITGASRGIGLAIALRAAADGANVVVVAKTTETSPKLPGTIHRAAQAIKAAGGQAPPVQCDIRDESSVQNAVAQAAQRFGGIDILVNNASAISMTLTPATPMKRFDLMLRIGFSNAHLPSPWHPQHGGTRHPTRLNLSLEADG